MMQKREFKIISYLDDFILIGHTEKECLKAQQILIELLTRLGFLVNWGKVVVSTKRLQFLGLVIDSELQQIVPLEDKLTQLKNMANRFLSKEKITKRQLQVSAGHIAFAAKAIYGAKTFGRIFIAALAALKRPGDHCRITKILRSEFQWWTSFVRSAKGLCTCSCGKAWPEIRVSTDASFSRFGAVTHTGYG